MTSVRSNTKESVHEHYGEDLNLYIEETTGLDLAGLGRSSTFNQPV
jgi:hypothetical protein